MGASFRKPRQTVYSPIEGPTGRNLLRGGVREEGIWTPHAWPTVWSSAALPFPGEQVRRAARPRC